MEGVLRYTHYSVQLSLPCIKIPSDVTFHDNLERTDQNTSPVHFDSGNLDKHFYQLFLITMSKHVSKRITTHSIETIFSNGRYTPHHTGNIIAETQEQDVRTIGRNPNNPADLIW